MTKFSDYAEGKIMDWVGGIATPTGVTPYVALFTSDPTDAASGTEVSGGSYARVNSSGLWTRVANAISNNAQINFPVASAGWGTVTHAALFDAASGGNMLMYCALVAGVTVNSGHQPYFATSNLQFSCD